MTFTKDDIKQAYVKLKSYVYYDNTDLLLRRQLVEFEANIGKDFLVKNPSSNYNIGGDIFNYKDTFTLDEKFDRIATELNGFHEDSDFFEALFSEINISFYPKKIRSQIEEENFISNVRIRGTYEIERITPFINAPIELHIIATLWIMKHGVSLDANLKSECLGNRLLLNKDKTEIVQGSGLFKPYFNQYQKWRDNAVTIAENILKNRKNVAFINLDIKDYFSSVRINRTDIFEGRKHKTLHSFYNLKEVFLTIHDKYSELLSTKFQSPSNFYNELIDCNEQLVKVVLPIGLVSSYVLANHYLKDFDDEIINIIKPAYYGRYVDDMLFVIADPTPNFKINQKNTKIKFDISKYKNLNPNSLEKFILETFHPIIDLKRKNEKSNEFILSGYESLYCQSEKSLIHYFDSNESHLVIDRLKQELDEKTSEFRDFPEEDENDLSFKSSAYHLHYDGTEGKIRTLKDYKENRFGLTVFLSNKIFSALRHENHLSDDECDQIVSFFKGETCLTFYRLWERILTLLLVNQKPKHYIEFFLHCFDEIEKLKQIDKNSKVENSNIKNTLIEYLDTSHELSLSLNLDFLIKTKEISRNFEFKLNKLQNSNWSFLSGRFEPTKANSNWITRFRKSNMMRHHYVIHPLLTYSKASKNGKIKNLIDIKYELKKHKLDETLMKESPRRVKFWECCMSIAFETIGSHNREIEVDSVVISDVFSVKKHKKSKQDSFYLDEAFERYKTINQNHIASYELSEPNFCDNLYIRKTPKENSSKVFTQEIIVSNRKRNSKKSRIAFANTQVNSNNIEDSIRGTPNLSSSRYNQLAKIINKVRLDKSDILLFPECFIPINLLTSLVKYSAKNQVLIITGLEHVKIKKTVFNFVVTILPFEVRGIKDAVVVFRLKNHYSHSEKSLIKGNHLKVASPKEHRYDIFNWENLYFCPYYCFELANVWHRSLFKAKLDLLVGVEWNKDTNYFSNIVESCSRDLHCYVAQVNTSQFGDSRLTQPTETARQDLMKLKGGINDSILVTEIDIDKIREFQRKAFELTNQEKEYKPLPPDYNVEDVLKRINNEPVL
ncbi:MAG: hypothetical protein ACOXZK_07055 [Bacteroidales bacterium]